MICPSSVGVGAKLAYWKFTVRVWTYGQNTTCGLHVYTHTHTLTHDLDLLQNMVHCIGKVDWLKIFSSSTKNVDREACQSPNFAGFPYKRAAFFLHPPGKVRPSEPSHWRHHWETSKHCEVDDQVSLGWKKTQAPLTSQRLSYVWSQAHAFIC